MGAGAGLTFYKAHTLTSPFLSGIVLLVLVTFLISMTKCLTQTVFILDPSLRGTARHSRGKYYPGA